LKVSISATNPCHVWDMARALSSEGALGTYYSGYPASKLRGVKQGMSIRSFSGRTVLVYGARRLLPERLRPKDRHLFRWQDWAFDRKVAAALEPCDFLHGLPGQCRDSFAKAREIGIKTVLSHATGPVAEMEKLVAPEYERVGLTFSTETQYDADYYRREEEEYALTDYHWAASTVVADQLRATGIPEKKIWVVPYGVDRSVFAPPRDRSGNTQRKPYRVVFAGQLSLRKGIRHLLDALTLLGDDGIEVEFYGHQMAEVEVDLSSYSGASPLRFHGPVSQLQLAEVLGQADLLVLPSIEEGYGLVVIQALACGLPCLVSDQVGSKDAIQIGLNGLVAASGDAQAWAEAIREAQATDWNHQSIVASAPDWDKAAAVLLERSSKV